MQDIGIYFHCFVFRIGRIEVISKGDFLEIKPPAPLMGVSGSRRRRRGGWLLPVTSAVVFHVLVLVMIVGSKPAPMLQTARAIDVSLISGLGQATLTVAASTFPTTALNEPKPIPAVSKSVIVTEAAPNPGSSLIVKPKLEPNAPKTLTTVFEQILSGGPSLTATPASIASQPSTAPPLLAQTAGETRCQLLENLKLSFQASDEVRAALRRIPKQSFSVANAILLWNGRWIDESSVGGAAALGPIEQAVAQTVSQTPPICQGEILHGVRFVTVGDASDTMVLAFGTADWRWSDLLATLSPPS